jgi:hypothetical protein
MRALGVIAALFVAACGQVPNSGGASPSPLPTATQAVASSSPSPTGAQAVASSCRLPVWWGDGSGVHAGFVSVPGAAFTDAGILPDVSPTNGLDAFRGATFDITRRKWLRASRPEVSPDGSHYAYWTADPTHGEIHVVDVATGSDHVAYSGPVPYILVGFESDAIYLAHIINARQGAFDRLYRLDPSGGTPQLVPGSDRHMYQWGWVLIADGAAWGIDNRASGNDYIYSVLRLDLANSQVTQWVEGPVGTMFWPQGVDGAHRLYAAPYSGPLWLIDAPGHAVALQSSAETYFGNAIGGPNSFVADRNGVWFSGQGSVWLYPEGQAPKQFTVGPPNEDVFPAGTCLS